MIYDPTAVALLVYWLSRAFGVQLWHLQVIEAMSSPFTSEGVESTTDRGGRLFQDSHKDFLTSESLKYLK